MPKVSASRCQNRSLLNSRNTVIRSKAILRRALNPDCHSDKRRWPQGSYFLDHGALPRVNRQIRAEFNHEAMARCVVATEIHVDIRKADFFPLKQFALDHLYWKKHTENGTRIKATLHYEPTSWAEACAWGVQRAEISSAVSFCPAKYFDISYEIAICEPVFIEEALQNCITTRCWVRMSQKIFSLLHLPQRPPQNIPIPRYLHLAPQMWSSHFDTQATIEILEMYTLIRATIIGSRRPVISLTAVSGIGLAITFDVAVNLLMLWSMYPILRRCGSRVPGLYRGVRISAWLFPILGQMMPKSPFIHLQYFFTVYLPRSIGY